jgi:hypothetical protein
LVNTEVVLVDFEAELDFAVVCVVTPTGVVDEAVGTAVVPVLAVPSDVDVSSTDDVVAVVTLVPDVFFFPPPHAASPTASRTVAAAR